MTNNNLKKLVFFCACLVFLLCFFGGATIIVDPYFHFHQGLEGMSYSFGADPRYINDGITRNWNYNAVITGTSMTQNFKPSEFDEYFDVISVKLSYEGASFYEIGTNLRKAFDSGHDVKLVLWSLDTGRLDWDAEYLDDNFKYPEYLTDYIWINDVNYIFNKDVLVKDTMKTVYNTIKGKPEITLDEYNSWDQQYLGKYGKDYVLGQYKRSESKSKTQKKLADEDYNAIQENIEKNIIPIIRSNEDTMFIFFFPPLSIIGLDSYNNSGEIGVLFDKQKFAYELLSNYKNVKVFSWQDNMRLVCDLDNYRDPWHYSGKISSEMLSWIKENTGVLTQTNYRTYFENCKDAFLNYNYDELF